MTAVKGFLWVVGPLVVPRGGAVSGTSEDGSVQGKGEDIVGGATQWWQFRVVLDVHMPHVAMGLSNQFHHLSLLHTVQLSKGLLVSPPHRPTVQGLP